MRRRKDLVGKQDGTNNAVAAVAAAALALDFGENEPKAAVSALHSSHDDDDDDHDSRAKNDFALIRTKCFFCPNSGHPYRMSMLGTGQQQRPLFVFFLFFFVVLPFLMLMMVLFLSKSSTILVSTPSSSCQLPISTSSSSSASNNDDMNAVVQVYASLEEANFRPFRFPSRQERLEIYLGNWYTPACSSASSSSRNDWKDDRRIHYYQQQQQQQQDDASNNQTISYVVQEEADAQNDQASEHEQRWFAMDTWIQPARIFYITRQTIADCSCWNSHDIDASNPLREQPHQPVAAAACTSTKIMRNYCRDVYETLLPLFATTAMAQDDEAAVAGVPPPILMQFGDATESLAHPAVAILDNRTMGGTSISSSSSSSSTTTIAAAAVLLLSQPRLPHMKKFRLAMNRSELQRVTVPPTTGGPASSSSSPHWLPSLSCCSSSSTDQETTTNNNSSSSTTSSHGLKECSSSTCCCCWNGPRPIPHTIRGVGRLQPIIWKLNTRRHYHNLPQVPCQDIAWEEKRNQGVFRGKLTGGGVAKNKANAKPNAMDSGNDHDTNGNSNSSLSDEAKCLQMPRCAMVLKHINSSLVDARLTSTSGKVPNVIIPDNDSPRGGGGEHHHPGWNLTAPKPLSLQEMLTYKAIVILEGNDVSSGLKWALLSNSVVLMPPPTMTSWLMEEWLEPWVHYVPLLPDLTNVEAQVQWVVQHSAEAQRIAHRGSLWVKDLVFHANAKMDDEIIFREMLRRYRQHFVHSPLVA
jgi:hypothetical protein